MKVADPLFPIVRNMTIDRTIISSTQPGVLGYVFSCAHDSTLNFHVCYQTQPRFVDLDALAWSPGVCYIGDKRANRLIMRHQTYPA
jgi:hypothetical protein